MADHTAKRGVTGVRIVNCTIVRIVRSERHRLLDVLAVRESVQRAFIIIHLSDVGNHRATIEDGNSVLRERLTRLHNRRFFRDDAFRLHTVIEEESVAGDHERQSTLKESNTRVLALVIDRIDKLRDLRDHGAVLCQRIRSVHLSVVAHGDEHDGVDMRLDDDERDGAEVLEHLIRVAADGHMHRVRRHLRQQDVEQRDCGLFCLVRRDGGAVRR